MEIKEQNVQDRIRESTPEIENQNIDQKIVHNIEKFQGPADTIISNRLEELENEWDIERYLEVSAASFGLAGLFMGTVFRKKWYFLTGIVSGFLLQQGLSGWCPPVPVLRALGVRARKEIEQEKYALKVLRGDFNNINASSEAAEIINSLRD